MLHPRIVSQGSIRKMLTHQQCVFVLHANEQTHLAKIVSSPVIYLSFSVFCTRIRELLPVWQHNTTDRQPPHLRGSSSFPYVISISQLQLRSPQKHAGNLQKHKGEGLIQVLCSEKRLASLFIGCHRESFMRKVLKAQQELIKLTQ